MGSISGCWTWAKPYALVIWLQLGFAGLTVIAKFAINKGLNHYSFLVYRHALATAVIAPFALIFERKVRPKMTPRIFANIMLLAFLEPVFDQNLSYGSLKYTTATFNTALNNMVPALTFIMAWIFSVEKVNLMTVRSQAKVVGTVVTVGGALLMTLVKGRMVGLPWAEATDNHQVPTSTLTRGHDQIKGAIMLSVACIGWSCFVILQGSTIQSYPAELSLTTLICGAGAVQGLILTLVMEWGNTSIWAIHFDSKLLACVYSGIVCSGLAYYVQGVVLKEKGPVFVAAFSPLRMVIVAVLSSFILAEQLSLGSVIGAIVIVVGLYLVIWGKSKDPQSSSQIRKEILPIHSKQTTAEKTIRKEILSVDSKQTTAEKISHLRIPATLTSDPNDDFRCSQ